MSNPIPERLINYRAYKDGNHLVGTADVELPSLEAMTDTVVGAGIAGELDSPTLGHFGSLGLTINWRTISKEAIGLAAQEYHALDFWGSQQLLNAASGKLETQAVRVSVRAMPKNTSLGTLAVSASTDTNNEFECSYVRIDVGGTKVLELDKLNFKFEVMGKDMMAGVRGDIGM